MTNNDNISWLKKLFSHKRDKDILNNKDTALDPNSKSIQDLDLEKKSSAENDKLLRAKNENVAKSEVDDELQADEKENIKDKIKEKIKEKIEEVQKKEDHSQIEEFKDILHHVIEPEERTLVNYINPNFWIKKRKIFKKFREKERQDLNIYEVLSQGAMPSIEYYFLTILSCIISTFGLIQGATATIIGAMIVAPLMTPILAFSLGVVWGDLVLIKRSFTSILKGILLVIIISSVIAFIVPIPSFTNEIISRTNPTLFDILVALASGTVGAYGYADKKISNTLIGIAIAVALMPPLCNIGIGIGTLNFHIAFGSSILFLINLVSIGLSGAVVFWWMKIHPVFADEGDVKKRALSQIIISVFVLLIISVPVGVYMYKGYLEGEALKNIRKVFEDKFDDISIFDVKLIKVEDKNIFNIILTGEKIPTASDVLAVKNIFLKEHRAISEINVRFIKSSNALKQDIQ